MHEIPDNFLGLEASDSARETSGVTVLPIPFEATVSYGGGTAAGPQAIITASQQVELYDREFGVEPALGWGVHTLAPLECSSDSATAMEQIRAAVAAEAARDSLLCVLGGEHAVSGAVAAGLFDVHGPFVTVQIDAHADLRDEYDDTPYSHACAMRRILDVGAGDLLQLGIRSLALDEAALIRDDPRVTTFFSEQVHDREHLAALREFVRGKPVFLTIDIDGLDIGLVPATGTPEPDGLTWRETLEIIRIVATEAASVLAFDVMELAPVAGQHASDFVAAKLTYKTMAIIMAARAAK